MDGCVTVFLCQAKKRKTVFSSGIALVDRLHDSFEECIEKNTIIRNNRE